MSQNVSQLFSTAASEGTISPQTAKLLAVKDIGVAIQAGLGVTVDKIQSSDVVLVTILPDDSGSISFAGNSQVVRDGHNMVLDALSASKQKGNILAHTRYLNGQILYPYVSLDQAVRMTSSNYDPQGGTPLYDQSIIVVGTVLAKTQEFADNGVPVRTVSLLITDGNDEHSRHTIKDAASVIKDALRSSENHIIAGMGIDDGHTDFKQVFQDMGIDSKWILTPGNTQSEIRKAFAVFSQSAVRASQNAASFSKTAMAGFGTV